MIRRLLIGSVFFTAMFGTALAGDAPSHGAAASHDKTPSHDAPASHDEPATHDASAAPDAGPGKDSSPAHADAPEPKPSKHAKPSPPSIDPLVALEMLKEGNARFVAGESTFPHLDQDRRCETTDGGQHPFAALLSCADSRVPPELAFDAGIGDLFVIRVAGNVADTDEIGTLEYGAGHLKTPLIVVMGHTKCGAVTAVVQGAKVYGSIPKLVDNIIPAVAATKAKFAGVPESRLVQLAIKQNVRQGMQDVLEKSEEIRELVADGKVMVVGAVYDIHNGTIEWLGELPNQTAILANAGHAPATDEVLLHKTDADAHSSGADKAHADAAKPSNEHDDEPKAAHGDEPKATLAAAHHAPAKQSADASHGAPKSATAKPKAADPHASATDHSASQAKKSAGHDDGHGGDAKAATVKKSSDHAKKSHAKDAHGDAHGESDSHGDASHAEESHGDADAHGEAGSHDEEAVKDDRTLVQKHGILVPAVFLAAGSLLSGTIVFILKSKGVVQLKPTAAAAAEPHAPDAKAH